MPVRNYKYIIASQWSHAALLMEIALFYYNQQQGEKCMLQSDWRAIIDTSVFCMIGGYWVLFYFFWLLTTTKCAVVELLMYLTVPKSLEYLMKFSKKPQLVLPQNLTRSTYPPKGKLVVSRWFIDSNNPLDHHHLGICISQNIFCQYLKMSYVFKARPSVNL